ncbi:hypothetical protein KOW79_018562 [Hemibagrus wyckioides]|uniref:Uncharacterized protein n=1 Tax=Hemibagrus wyckioides TaxID=337641 RepID=A0A9D3SB51_9TELE|nr:hypothetical protein KOW79_018562 [Hemibagrus wyckioides]
MFIRLLLVFTHHHLHGPPFRPDVDTWRIIEFFLLFCYQLSLSLDVISSKKQKVSREGAEEAAGGTSP